MRNAFPSRRAWRLLPLLALLSTAAAEAAPAKIDPDPGSPTLGDLLEREKRQAAQRADAGPTGTPRGTSPEAKVPADAATVLVPGGRSRPVRIIPIHRSP